MFSGLMLQNKAIDNDTHFLLNSGRYVMEHGIPHVEPFTMHEGLLFFTVTLNVHPQEPGVNPG
jgi:hypothetical protein